MKKSSKKAIAVGAGAAALAAAAAGTYFFAGKRGAKNRAKVKKWAVDAKKEITKQVGSIEKVSQKAYHSTVDKVLKQVKNVDKAELLAVAKDLKAEWTKAGHKVQKAVKAGAKKIVKETKAKPAKKPVAKKASPKKTSKKK